MKKINLGFPWMITYFRNFTKWEYLYIHYFSHNNSPILGKEKWKFWEKYKNIPMIYPSVGLTGTWSDLVRDILSLKIAFTWGSYSQIHWLNWPYSQMTHTYKFTKCNFLTSQAIFQIHPLTSKFIIKHLHTHTHTHTLHCKK